MSTFKKIRNELFKIFFVGKKCLCMYCGKRYQKFMHEGVKAGVFKKYAVAGGGYKKNVKCPNCGSTDRIRLLHLFFELRTNIYKNKTKLLHISPNRQLGHVLKSHSTIDYTCGALEPEKFLNLNSVKLDVTKIAFEDALFDVVICNHVLEHIPNDIDAMKEIFRVLKSGGFAVLQVPLALDLATTIEDPSLVTRKQRKIAYGQTDHLRLYGLDYFDKLQSVGFKVERDNPFTNKWSEDLEKYCLDKNEDVIIAHKSN